MSLRSTKDERGNKTIGEKTQTQKAENENHKIHTTHCERFPMNFRKLCFINRILTPRPCKTNMSSKQWNTGLF